MTFRFAQGFGGAGNRSVKLAPPQAQREALLKYNHLMSSFLSRSLWFGRLLKAIGQGNETVLGQFREGSKSHTPANFLRVSLHHYQFSTDSDHAWSTRAVPTARYVINLKESSP